MKTTSRLNWLFPAFIASLFGLAGIAGAQVTTNTYSTAGTNTFTVTVGVTQIVVQAWGGGGGGHQGTFTGERPGGGGGAYASSTLTVTSGVSYTIVVGNGGTAGNPGQTGGASRVFSGNVTNVLAAGGGGARSTSLPGLGGTVAASIGQVEFAGGDSIDGASNNGGGGGGSAFTNANGGTGAVTAGGTGTGNGGNGGTSGNPGQDGNAPGGGGGGRGDSGVNSGAGAVGRVIIVSYAGAANVPAQLAYVTAPQSIYQSDTSAVITVELRGTNNLVAPATNNVTVNLSSSLGGTFRNSNNTANVTSVVISNGQSQAHFRYTSGTAGTHVLTVSNAQYGATNQNLTVVQDPVPTKLVFSTGPQTVTVSNLTGLITIQIQGTNSQAKAATNDVTVNLSGSLAGVFRNSNNTANITSAVISNGQTEVSVRFIPTVVGTYVLTASDNAGQLLSATQNLFSVAASTIVQTYYIPFDENGAQSFFESITATATLNTNVAVMSISPFASNTVVYVDHWEDGYELNLSNPTQATTEIWGNQNIADGCPPNGTNAVPCAVPSDDVIDRGEIIFSFDLITIPRNPAEIYHDGGDKIGVTRPVAISRSGWDTGPATLLAGSVEVADTAQWGQRYEIPAGTNVPTEGQAFDITGVSVMALTNNTTVALDLDRNGTFDIVTNINEGQTYNLTNFIIAGSVITSSAPVQVHLSAGLRNSNYRYDWYTIAPFDQWGSEYYNPVGSTRADSRADVVLFNPNTNSITVFVEYSDGEEIFTESRVITAGNFGYQSNTFLNSAQRYFTTNGAIFYGLGLVDAATGAGTTWDWGFSLVPENELTPLVLIGWAPGRDPLSATGLGSNVSPVWVTSTRPTIGYIDFDGDGGVFTNDCGTYDTTTNIAFLQSVKVYDPDGDQTGMKIFTCDGTLLTAAWGEDPTVAPAGQPSLDIGTTVLPLPTIAAEKSVAFAPGGDLNGDNTLNPGEIIRYTIIVTNPNLTVSGGVTVQDTLPPEALYVTNSTRLDGATVISDSGTTAFPLDEGGYFLGVLQPLTARYITFEAAVTNPYLSANSAFTNRATVFDDVSTVVLAVEVESPVTLRTLLIDKESDATVVTNGQVITYTIVVSNTGTVQQVGITVTDAVPASVSYIPGTVQVTAPVETGNVATNTVRDDFSSVNYSLNTGTANWLGNWVEESELAQSPTNGSIIINNGRLRITNTNAALSAVHRSANLSGALGATLSYRYEASNNLEIIDWVIVDVSTNNGGSYVIMTNVTSFSGSRSGTANIDISPYASTNTRVRFRVNSGYSGVDEFFRVDWVQIQYTTGTSARVTNTFAGTAPPILHTGQELHGGESMTITFQAKATNNLSGVFAITNIACAFVEGEAPICDNVVDPVLLAGGLSLVKTVSKAGYPGSDLEIGTNGTQVTYWFLVSNTGIVPLVNVQLTDPLVAYSTNIGSLAIGQQVTVSVADVISGPLTNTATVTGQYNTQTYTNTDTAVVLPITPDINIEKTVDDDTTFAGSGELVVGTNGQAVTYFFVVSNPGNVALTNVVVTDLTISPTYSTNLGTLAAGASRTVQVTRSISGDLLNTASVTGYDTLGSPHTDSDTAEVDLIIPDITIEKTVDDDTTYAGSGELVTATNGQVVTYFFVVSNPGNVALTNVTVTDVTISPSYSTNLGTLAAGAVVTVQVNDAVSGNLTNTATANGFDTLGNPHNDNDTAEVRIISPDITIEKTVDDDTTYAGSGELVTATNGQVVTYFFVVSNPGNVALTNVTVTDVTISPSYSTNLGTLAAGAVVTVQVNDAVSGNLTNTATANGFDTLGNPHNDNDTAEVRIISPDITIEKTVDDDTTYAGSGELVTATNGQVVTYFFVVSNPGNVALTNVTVTDVTISPSYSTNLGTLVAGAVVTVQVNDAVSGNLTNTATANGFDTLGNPHNDNDTAEVRIISPDITIEKTVDDDTTYAGSGELVTATNGQVVTYFFVVSNPGNVALTNVTVTDVTISPSYSTNLGTLAAGAVVTVQVNDAVSGNLTNTASANGFDTLGNPHNDSDTAEVRVVSGAITVEKTVDDDATFAGSGELVVGTNGQAVTYFIVVSNAGDVTLTNVVLNDLDIPYSTNVGTLAVGQSVTVAVADAISGDLTNTVTATGQDPLSNTHTDSDTAEVASINPDITIEKTVDDDTTFADSGELVVGTNSQAVTYFFVVENVGDVLLTNVVVNDADIPYNTTISTLAAGESVTVFAFSVISGDLTNTATASGYDPLGLPHSDDDTAEVAEINGAITVEKTVDDDATFAGSGELVVGTNGQAVTYFIVVSNAGDVTLTNVVLNDLDIPYTTNVGTLAVGQSVTVSVADAISGDLTNTVTASGNDPLGNPHTDSDTAEVAEISGAISVEKTVDDDDTFFGSGELVTGTNGQVVTYFIVVSNVGDVTLTNVVLNDLDIPYTTNVGTLAVGQSVTVSVADAISGDLTNTVTATGNDPLGNPHTDSDTAEVAIIDPGITVVKTVSDDTTTYPGVDLLTDTNGTPLVYWFLVTNVGDVTLTNVSLVDLDIPFATNVGTLAAGQVITVSVADVLSANLTNTVTAFGYDPVGQPHSDSDIAEVRVVGPAISVNKTVSKDGSFPGGEFAQGTNNTPVTYWIVVENQGDAVLTNVTLLDNELSYSTNIGTLAAGQSVTVSVSSVISTDLVNTVYAQGYCECNGQPYNDDDIAVVDLIAPDITIEKTVDDDTTFAGSGELVIGTNGQQVTYFFLVTNAGDVTLTNVVINDPDIPFNTSIGSLSAGQVVTVQVNDAISGDLTNTATVTGYDPQGNPHNDDDTAEVAEVNPDINVEKTVDDDATFAGSGELVVGTNGQAVTYFIVVSNVGDVILTNVVLNDLDIPYTTNVGTLAIGQSVTVSVADAISGDLTNTVTATGYDVFLGLPHEDADTAEVATLSPSINVEKTVDDDTTIFGSGELTIGTNGQAVTYFIVVSNNGDTTLTNVTLNDLDIPYTTNVGTLVSGQSVTVSVADVISGDLTNTVTASGYDITLGLPHDDSDTAEVAEINPSITVEKTVDDDATYADSGELVVGTNGQAVTYFIVVSNNGDTTLTNVTLNDLDIPYTTNVGTLVAGQSVTVSVADVISGDLTNTVTASGYDITLGLPHTDSDTAEVAEIDPSITVEKTVDDDATYADSGELVVGTNGQAVTYFIVVSNNGDTTLTNVTLNDLDIPYTTNVGTLVAGQSVTVSVADAISGDLTNTVTAAGYDITLGLPHDDSDTAEVAEIDPSIMVEKTVDDDATYAGSGELVVGTNGQAVTYFIVVSNNGDTTLTNVTLNDLDIPYTTNVGTLVAGQSVTVSVADAISGDLTNTVTASGYDITLGLPHDDSDTAEVAEIDPSITVEKTVDDDATYADSGELVVGTNGQAVTYFIVVSNNGDTTLTNVTLNDLDIPYTTNVGTLVAGQSVTVSVADAISGDLTNTVTASGYDITLGLPHDDSDTAEVAEIDPSITVEKTVDDDATYAGSGELVVGTNGQAVTYFIVVSNNGDSTLTNVTLNDLDIPYTTNVGTLVAGQSVTVSVADAISGDLTNTVTASGYDITLGLPHDDSDTAEVAEIDPSITVEKTVDDDSTYAGSGELVVGTNGQAVTYFIVVSNNGDTTLTNVTLNDLDIPYSTNVGTLVVGQSVTVSVADVISANLTNTVTATGNDPLGNPHSDSDTAEVREISGAIVVQKTVDDDATYDGSGELVVGTNSQAVTYFIVVSNAGDVTLTNVTLNDLDIPYTTNVGTLVAGQSVTVSVADAISADLTNTVTATGQDPLGNTHSDDDTAEVREIAPAVSLVKTVSDTGSYPGSDLVQSTNGTPIVYWLVVSNDGDVALTNTVINDPLIPYTTNIGTLAVGQVVTLAVNDVISADLTNTATVTGYDPNGNPHTDDDTAVVLQLMRITGSVFVDVNGDGAFDPEDTNGINGVTVTLYDSQTNVIGVTTTAVNGAYAFLNLPPGSYFVVESDLPGYISTGDVDGPNDNRIDVTLVSGVDSNGNDFLDTLPGRIGDFVWDDLDGDGIQDLGEPGITNVTVTLYDDQTNVVDTTTTDASGFYLFTNVAPASGYFVGFGQPTEYVFTPANQGGNDAVDSDANVTSGLASPITILSGTVNTNQDAGLYIPAAVSGSVFVDIDGDGNFDAEDTNGINGVTVTLYDSQTNVIGVTTTAVNGAYAFTNLPPGAYFVVETDPAGYVSTADTDGPNDNRIDVTLQSGDNSTGNDFLDTLPGRIGDFVWDDLDGDGIQDLGEPGITNVTVTLYDDQTNVVDTTTTDATGFYLFTNVAPASGYFVGFGQPSEYVFTPANQGGNDAVDSDANVTSGLASPITILSGTVNTNQDAGLYIPASISGSVFLDVNTDGTFDPEDTNGINGVTVTLYDSQTNVIGVTTTAVNGAYAFTNLPPGAYFAVETDLPAYFSTGDVDGPNDNRIDVTVQSGDDSTGNDFLDAQLSEPKLDKVFVSASEVDANGNFSATYTIYVINPGASAGIYNLVDTPNPDTNVTFNGATVSGYTNLSFVGAGPYVLATNETIAAMSTNIYSITLDLTLSSNVLNGISEVSLCGGLNGIYEAGEGLFNEVTAFGNVGTNYIEITTNDCGNIPPFILIDKTFVDASEADASGLFSATYQITVRNVGGNTGLYDLDDTPGFDTNITVLGAAVSGQYTTNYTGAGPYALANGASIGAGDTHTYNLVVTAQLSLAQISGIIEVSECLEVSGSYVSGRGLFNEATVTYGTNDTTVTTNDCGNVPPVILVDKTFVSASEPDANGDFSATYTITVQNIGATDGAYDLSDLPSPDTNVTVNSAAISGQLVTNYTGAGPYTLATGTAITAGDTHAYTLTLDLTLQSQVLNGSVDVSLCGEEDGSYQSGEGLFNEVTLVYGTNDTTITTNDCGNVPPVLVPFKTFVTASEPDQSGNFSATYTITMVNVGGTDGTYDLSDLPSPDTNITVNGAAISGQVTTNYTGAGPYTLATGATITAGDSHVYTLVLDLTLRTQVLDGSVDVSLCSSLSGGSVAGEGLFNAATVTYGTNDTTITTNDCGNVPPFMLIDKTFVTASEPDANGDFSATYTITVQNVGGTSGAYDLSDLPQPDTNITVNGVAVSGQITTNYTGAGPYTLATGTALGAGASHSYTLVLDLTLQSQVLDGSVDVSECSVLGGGSVAGEGLFNEATLVYGTNDTTVTDDDCGNVPPVILVDKTAVDASEPDANGNFSATYTITVVNIGGTSGAYDLTDLPQPDTNVTVNGVAISGQLVTNYTGAGPYVLANGTVLAAGATHTYTLVLDLTLQDQVLDGSVTVSSCYESEAFLPGNGLFNRVTLTYGTNDTTITTNDCLDVPPFILIDKTFVTASEPDANGEFAVTYQLTVWNVGGSPGVYDLEDEPQFDTNITVSGGAVSGHYATNLTGAGPYQIVANEIIQSGDTHTYSLVITGQLSLAQISGIISVTECEEVSGSYVSGRGLFNEATVTYGTNDTTITTNDCGNVPPFILVDKTFVSASEPDANGDFSATYTITVQNAGATDGTYDLADLPQPDTNVTVNGAAISGQLVTNYTGAGPYTLATGTAITAGDSHSYTLVLDLTLQSQVLNGSVDVSLCGEEDGSYQSGEGLFNEVTLVYGTNDTTITTNDCGNVPPFILIDKTFVTASEPDANGDFAVTYQLTVWNVGGTAGTYDLEDDPQFDTNITVSGGAVAGHYVTNLTGAGPYQIVTNEPIAAGGSHVYTITLDAQLSLAQISGIISVTECEEVSGSYVSGRGLFNVATVTYGTNDTTVTTNDCGNVPPFMLIDKTFVTASEPDANGDFSATYTITVQNVGGTSGAYDLSDLPQPDTNITVNGVAVSGQITTNYTGAGPYTLATGTALGAGASHSYTLVLDLTLQSQVLDGSVDVSECSVLGSGSVAGEGLFNEATLVYGTNDTTVTDDDCGNVPPFMLIDKTFVSASEPDLNGDFSATYTITVVNVGGQSGTYDLSDLPEPDTNITVNGVAVSGQVTTNYTGAGPYVLADDTAIAAGDSHSYTLVVDLTLQSQVLDGSVAVSLCEFGQVSYVANQGLFNEATLVYGTNSTTLTDDDCGEVPPIILIEKTFVSASAPNGNGDFVASYSITVYNVGGTTGAYDLSDTSAPDTNITINGVSITDHVITNYIGAGPYSLAVNESIASGDSHTYMLDLDLTLQAQVIDGSVHVSLCGENGGDPVAGEGLFNEATVTFGTNDLTRTDDDCGDIPPFLIIDKVFVSASEPDLGGNFEITYLVTVENAGGSSEIYFLEDTPAPDTNVTINGAAVTGQTNDTFVGAGPYLLTPSSTILPGETHVYTLRLDAVMSPGVMDGSTYVSLCEEGENGREAGFGLFNEVRMIYGDSETEVVTNACGDVPPVVLSEKTFVTASEPDLSGNFEVTYEITVWNTGGSSDAYDLVDDPNPDANVTISSAAITGHTNVNFVGAGPYSIVVNEAIAAGATHVYTVKLAAVLSPDVLDGTTNLTYCGQNTETPQGGEGLFNQAILTYGTNDTSRTNTACGDIPPVIRIDKTFVGASDINGDGTFLVTYDVTVANVGGSDGSYDLTDTPDPDTNVTVLGGTVSGETNAVLAGAGPYTLATDHFIPLGNSHVYTLVLTARVSTAVMNGSVLVSECGEGSAGSVAGEGLFNAATVVYGTNDTTITTNDCGNLPPVPRYLVIKQITSQTNRPALIGEQFVFNITVTNNGEVGLATVPVVDTYNTALMSYVGAVPTNDSFAPGTITWTNVGPLQPGQSKTITVTFAAIANGNGTNVATVTAPVTTNGVPLPPQTSSAPHSANAGSISGEVRDDVDVDGNFGDADAGIPGVTISLLNSNLVVIGVTTTDVNGAYAFTNLPAGSYRVVETDPAGYFSTADVEGANDNTINLVLSTGQNSTGNDFLDARYAAVGDLVWLDNGPLTGIKENTEGGYPEVKITLYNTNDVVIGVTTSAVNGFYAFTNLLPGSYYMRVGIPLGSGISPQFQGSDPTIDSDFSPTTAKTPVFTLVAGQNNTNIDAGLYEFLILAQVEKVSGAIAGGQAVLSWETKSEFGTAGWYIERMGADGEWARVSDFLPAAGSMASGASYAWVDAEASAGSTVSYRIVEVEAQGGGRVTDTYTVTYPKASKSASAAVEAYRFTAKPAPAIARTLSAQAESSVAGGVAEAVKVAVTKPGLYRVTDAQIASALGVSESAVASSDIVVENLGMEVPSVREFGGVVFYGERYESIYTDRNIYRLSLGSGATPAAGTVAPINGTVASSFEAEVVLEQQSILKSDLYSDPADDVWVWHRLLSGSLSVLSNFTATLDLPELAAGSAVQLEVRLKGGSTAAGQSAHGARIEVNGTVIGQVAFNGLEHIEVSLEIPAGVATASGNQIKVVTTPQAGVNHDTIYVDGFTATYQKRFVATADSILFTGEGAGVSVSGFTSADVEVWDVTDRWSPVKLEGFDVESAGATWSVGFQTVEGVKYLVTAAASAPAKVSAWYANDLKDTANEVDYLVVYGAGLQAGAQALADDRAAKGLSTKVVAMESIDDAFNHGIRDGRTLKAFLGYAYRQWLTSPRYVVLAGDGSIDYRNYTGAGDCLIPTAPEGSAYGVIASDHNLGDVTGDGVIDMAVGRIPVTTAAQLSGYVAKLQAFEQGGAWRGQAMVATDNRDQGGVYVSTGDKLAAKLAGRTVSRADIESLGAAGTESALKAGIQSGQELTLYVGHGSMFAFAQEGILNPSDAQSLINTDKPGVVGALGCLMGTFGLPGVNSVGESLITSAGGAAAMFGSAALVNERDSAALFETLMSQVYEDGVDRLGDAWVNAKNTVVANDRTKVSKTYQMLGDPSIAMGDVHAPRGGPVVTPTRASYAEWQTWAFAPAWIDLGLATDSNGNADGDELNNWEEYLAGTDPVDGGSDLVVVTVKPLGGDQVQLQWPSVGGRTYRIERADAVSGTFEVLEDNIEATGAVNTWIDHDASTESSFYRVYVK